MGTHSAGSFCERAGNPVKTCSRPAAHVVSATDTSNDSYQPSNCHFPGLFSEERQTEAAEACSGERVPRRAGLAAALPGLPCRGRGPLPPLAPLPRFPGHTRSFRQRSGRIPGAGAELQTRSPPRQPFARGKREYWAPLVGDLTCLPGFLYCHGLFWLAHRFLASVQPSASAAKGSKFLQEGDRNCLLCKSNFPRTCLLTLTFPK